MNLMPPNISHTFSAELFKENWGSWLSQSIRFVAIWEPTSFFHFCHTMNIRNCSRTLLSMGRMCVSSASGCRVSFAARNLSIARSRQPSILGKHVTFAHSQLANNGRSKSIFSSHGFSTSSGAGKDASKVKGVEGDDMESGEVRAPTPTAEEVTSEKVPVYSNIIHFRTSNTHQYECRSHGGC